MKAKMTDQVRLPSGEIVVLGDAISSGRATLSKSERLYAKNDLGYRTAYFADFPEFEGTWCVEISKAAYDYRTTGICELQSLADWNDR